MARAPRSELRKVKGAPLATRLAVALAAVTALFMVGLALFLRGFLYDVLETGVRRTAFEAARAAARTELDAWGEYFGTNYQGFSAKQIQAVADGFATPAEFERGFLTPDQKDVRAWNRGRMRRFLDEESTVLAVDVFSPDGTRVLLASYAEDMEFTPFQGTSGGYRRGDVKRGRLNLGGTVYPVIRGEYPFLDRKGDVQAIFAVYIDARSIDAATEDLMLKVTWAAALFVLLGVALAFALGRRISRPLKLLQDDVRAVAGGDLEHRTKPHSTDEIGELARTFDHMTQTLAEARETERAAAASQRQVSVAAEVSASLFPETLPELEGYELAGYHRAAEELGGEYYDVLSMPGGRYGCLVAAASGSGVASAMVMAMARSFLTVVARDEAEPDAVLRKTNALLSGHLRSGLYVSVLLAVLDPESGTLQVANAGHHPLDLFRAADGKLISVASEGIALGFDEGPVFDRTLRCVSRTLDPGDRVLLYAPGVLEVIGSDGSALGVARFRGLLKREGRHAVPLAVQRIAATLAKFHGEGDLQADVTLLALGRQEAT